MKPDEKKDLSPFSFFFAKSIVPSNDTIDFLSRLLAENDFAHSAQLVKIIYRAKGMKYITTWLKHFLYKHEKYIHPNYIVENKVTIAEKSSETKKKKYLQNVTLLSVEKDYAVFCVSDPEVDVLDAKQFPFAFLSQYFNVTHLVSAVHSTTQKGVTKTHSSTIRSYCL